MKDQVREMKRQFDESGPRVEFEDTTAKYRAEYPRAGMPVLLTLTNRGRETAQVKRLWFHVDRGGSPVRGPDLPASMITPKPPFELSGLDKVEWSINWKWLCDEARA